MFWIILFTVFFIPVVVMAFDKGDLLFSLFIGTILGSMFSFIFVAICFLIIQDTLPTTTETYTVPIYSATSKDQLHGNFVFGIGSVNSVDKYSTFIKSGNGKKKYVFDSYNVTIIETNSEQPHLNMQHEVVEDCWWTNLVAVKSYKLASGRNSKVIEMVVPEGSVTTSFNIE